MAIGVAATDLARLAIPWSHLTHRPAFSYVSSSRACRADQSWIEPRARNGQANPACGIVTAPWRKAPPEWRTFIGVNVEAVRLTMLSVSQAGKHTQLGQERRGLRAERLGTGLRPRQMRLFQQDDRDAAPLQKDGGRGA